MRFLAFLAALAVVGWGASGAALAAEHGQAYSVVLHVLGGSCGAVALWILLDA